MKGEGQVRVFQSCHDTEHYKHVESHVVSQDRCIFPMLLRECGFVCVGVCVCACVHAGMWVGVHVKVCERTCTCLQRGVRVRGVRARCKCAGTPLPHQGCERRVAARAIARV